MKWKSLQKSPAKSEHYLLNIQIKVCIFREYIFDTIQFLDEKVEMISPLYKFIKKIDSVMKQRLQNIS